MSTTREVRMPSIRVADDGEMVCSPVANVPSEEILARIIDTVRGKLPNGNLFVHIHPEDRHDFETKGWLVAGIVTNFFGLGQHSLKMRLPV